MPDDIQQLHEKLDELLRIARENHRLGEHIMSAITDYTDQVNANFAKIATGITSLDTAIQQLQTQLQSAGTLSASDAAALQAVVDQSAALATSANAPPPAAPAPAPAPTT